MMALSLNSIRAVGLEKRTKTRPVVIATPTIPSRISMEATVWPIRLAGDIFPYPTVARVSILKKK
jgi:hypothetical protein